MNRPIKFRAWNKTKSVMLSAGDVGECRVTVLGRSHIYGTEATPDEYEWMQFTGLLDREGKEIYEGDVVGEEGFCFPVTWIEGAYHIGNSQTLIEWMHARQRRGEGTEVIGNIYENPNLLSV